MHDFTKFLQNRKKKCCLKENQCFYDIFFKGWKNPDHILLRSLSQIVDNCLKSPIDKAISEMIESLLLTMTRLEARMISLLWLHLLSRSLVAIMNTMNKIKHWTTWTKHEVSWSIFNRWIFSVTNFIILTLVIGKLSHFYLSISFTAAQRISVTICFKLIRKTYVLMLVWSWTN